MSNLRRLSGVMNTIIIHTHREKERERANMHWQGISHVLDYFDMGLTSAEGQK